MRSFAAFIVFAAVAWLAHWPAWRLEGWVGTEGRRVEIAREMLASGDWIAPTMGLEPTLAKPPGLYWILASLQDVFGVDALAMRAPSVVALLLLAMLAFVLLRRSHGAAVGWVAGLGMLCSPTIIHHGAAAEIDPLFASATAASLLLLGRGVGFGSWTAFAGAGLFGAAALLTKGPPYFVFLLGPLLVCWRRRLWPWRGLGIYALLMLLPVVGYYVALAGHPVSGTLADIAGEETVGRLFRYELRHVLDTPLHFVRVALIMLPLLLFVFAEFRGTHEAQLERAEVQQRFCTAAAFASVLLLAVFPGRSVRYMLPAVLLFIIGVAPAVVGFVRYPAPLGLMPRRLLRVLGVLGALVLCVLPFVRDPYPMPGASLWFAFGLALAPILVTTRVAVVGFAFALPVLAAWTVLEDRRARFEHGVRSAVDVGGMVEAALRERGVYEVATYGHVTYSYLFGLDTVPAGDERERRAPRADWLLVEQNADYPGRTPGYVDRVRIRARNRSVTLQERLR